MIQVNMANLRVLHIAMTTLWHTEIFLYAEISKYLNIAAFKNFPILKQGMDVSSNWWYGGENDHTSFFL